jgi:hypothetical protein
MNAMNGHQTKLMLAAPPESEREPAGEPERSSFADKYTAALEEHLAEVEGATRPATLEGVERHAAGRRADLEFDWSTDPDVIIHEQPETAVYTNLYGQIVIRQKAGPLEEVDSVVLFNTTCIAALIEELKRQLTQQ